MTSCSWLGRGRHDALLGVADGGDADAGAEVDEPVAVDVDEDRAVRALDVDGQRGGDAGGDDLRSSRVQLLRLRTGDGGHDLALLGHGVDRGGRGLSGSLDVSHDASKPIAVERSGRGRQGAESEDDASTDRRPRMLGEHHYAVEVEWEGDRGDGHVRLPRVRPRSTSCAPPASRTTSTGSSDRVFHGDRERWNPEELLLAALSECHMLSYLHVADPSRRRRARVHGCRDGHDDRRRPRRRRVHRA